MPMAAAEQAIRTSEPWSHRLGSGEQPASGQAAQQEHFDGQRQRYPPWPDVSVLAPAEHSRADDDAGDVPGEGCSGAKRLEALDAPRGQAEQHHVAGHVRGEDTAQAEIADASMAPEVKVRATSRAARTVGPLGWGPAIG